MGKTPAVGRNSLLQVVLPVWILIVAIPGPAFSQEKIQQDVLVVKSYLPSVQDARKITFLPDHQDSLQTKPRFTYSIESQRIPTSFVPSLIKPAKLLPEPLDKQYGNFLKLGIGSNFSTNMASLAELSLNTTRKKDFLAGISVGQQGQRGSVRVDGNKFYPSWSDTKAGAYARKFYSKSVFTGKIDLSREKRGFYGMDPWFIDPVNLEKDSFDTQQFLRAGLEAGIRSIPAANGKREYSAQIDYQWFGDSFKARENHFKMEGWYAFPYQDKYGIKLLGSADYLNYNQENIEKKKSLTLLNFSPSITRKLEESVFSAGFNLSPVIQSGGKGEFHLFPFASFDYRVYDNYLVSYFGFEGNCHSNSLSTLTRGNPFLLTDSFATAITTLLPTIEKLNLFAGFKGNISSLMTFDTRVGYSEWEKDYFFRPYELIMPARAFRIVPGKYDLFSANAQVSLKKDEGFSFDLRAAYYHYMNVKLTDSLPLSGPPNIPWNRPSFEMNLKLGYNLQQKLLGTISCTYWSKRTAALPNYPIYTIADLIALPEKENLKPITDISIGLEYRYNRKASAFLQLNNLLGQKAMLFSGYPGFGFQALLGVSYGF